MTQQPASPNKAKQANFTNTPNILFASYRHLSKEEKFLWIILKSLYWDGKTRSMGLREWSEATGYSTGALSKMFPRLALCQLIAASIEREGGKGNPKYKVAVLDIGELNKRFFSCSPNEQALLDPSKELVHENTQTRSPNEQTRSRKRTGSFTKRDKPVHENVQDNAAEPPAESDESTPKDSLKDDLKISLKMNEDSGASPTPSNSEDSFIHSSDINNSSEETKTPALIQHPVFEYVFLDDPISPTTLILMLTGHEMTDDSRRHAAAEVTVHVEERGHKLKLRCMREESSVVEPSVSDLNLTSELKSSAILSTATGGDDMLNLATVVKMGTVEPPDNDASLQSSPQSVLPDETVSNVDQLRFWLKKLGIHGSSDASKKAADLQMILPDVHSKDDLISLFAYAEIDLFNRYGEHRKAFLGNMATCVKDWLKWREQGQLQPVEESYTPSPQGMTLVERDELVGGALAYCPDFVINGTLEAPYFVAIWESEESIIEMGHPDDWGRIPQARLDRAAEYGARYWRAREQQEAVAV